MKVAVEGCCHGELDKIYDSIKYLEEQNGYKVDLLLICGDFQAVRNQSDLQCMAVPEKFQLMNTFYRYYKGEKEAPMLTVIIGGNHEASNYFQELPYGGWIAPKMYYMGYAGVINVGGLRIGGISGIYKGQDYHTGHHEHLPYNRSTMRSVYHVRNLEVFRLKQLKNPLDIVLSHDWPRNIYDYGDKDGLLRFKPYFEKEINNGELGSPANEDLLFHLKPSYWFSAHLHAKFSAVVKHKPSENGVSAVTKFLALDKCLPGRRFLQVLDFPNTQSDQLKIELDAEWLCVLKLTNHLLHTKKSSCYMPGLGGGQKYNFTPTQDDVTDMVETFGGDLSLPNNFERTAPCFESGAHSKGRAPLPELYVNPQTTLICEMLGILDPTSEAAGRPTSRLPVSDSTLANESFNPDEINLDDDDGGDDAVDSCCDADETTIETPKPYRRIAADSTSLAEDAASPAIMLTLPPPSVDEASSLSPPAVDEASSASAPDCSPLPVDSKATEPDAVDAQVSESSTDVVLPTVHAEALTGQDTGKCASTSSESVATPQPPTKKFRRRNVALYGASGD